MKVKKKTTTFAKVQTGCKFWGHFFTRDPLPGLYIKLGDDGDWNARSAWSGALAFFSGDAEVTLAEDNHANGLG